MIWGIFFPPVLLQGQQEGAGQQGQGEVMVPAGPTAHLVLVQARFAFGRLDLGLDDPAGRRDLGQRQQWRVSGGIGQVVARLGAIAIAAQQQPTGAPVVGILVSVLVFQGVSSFWQGVVEGVILAVVVAITTWRRGAGLSGLATRARGVVQLQTEETHD